MTAFRGQMTAVQARHQWAVAGQPAEAVLRRAGDLSTSTNAALAAAFHVEAAGYGGWLRSSVRPERPVSTPTWPMRLSGTA